MSLQKDPANKPYWRARSGQSLIEMTLALPLLLLMLTGLLEFGFALNQYLNALDAAREGARFASDGDPLLRSSSTDCSTTIDFYMQTACVAEQTMSPIQLNPVHDDIVISVFRVLNGHVIDRWPNCSPTNPVDCPNNPSPYPPVRGEWHRWGKGDQCRNGMDDDGDGAIDDGCVNPADAIGAPESTCNEATDMLCHPSHFTIADVEARLDPTAPNTAVMLVEVFYAYDQLLKLPWITAFVPDPIRMHSYTIIPVPAAEPSLAISGTVTHAGGAPFAGVTINFSTGAVAVSDANGDYIRKGFDSGSVTVTAVYPACTFNPPSYNVVLVNQDVGSVNFQEAVCIPTATPTLTPSQTNTPNPLMTSTQTPSPTDTPTPTLTQTPTRTPTPTVTASCTSGQFDAAKSSVAIITPPTGIVQADNTSTAQIVVTARDNCFNIMSGLPVSLSSSRGGTDSISPGSATTNGSGQAVFTVKSAVMSPWNTVTSVFTPSVFNATLNSVVLASHADINFVCVRGEGVPAGGNNEVFWQFTNSSSIARRLVRLDITWPQETGRLLQEARFGGTSIWNLSANYSPVTINSNWIGSPNSRDLPDTVSKSLLVTFNFLVTGSQEFTVKAYWDDSNGASTCDSGSVTIIRTGAGTAAPTQAATSTPQPTVTPTVTRTPTVGSPTATPIGTLTPTPPAPTLTLIPSATATPTVTNTPTATTVPPTATRTSTPTATTVPPTATRTSTPTATNTPTATPTPGPTDLFFSEYVEGSSNNQALEIYNGTGASVDLAAGNYIIEIYRQNHTTVDQTINLAGTITNGNVWVVVRSSANATLLALADQTAGGNWFNGDDTIILKHNGTVLDVFGQRGVDPGTGYGSGSTSSKDHTLRRKAGIITGDTNDSNAFDPAAEWDGFAMDDFSGLRTR